MSTTSRQPDRDLSIRRLTDDLEVGLGREDEPEPRADHLLIVGNQDTDGHAEGTAR
jgi:hypothetical protein